MVSFFGIFYPGVSSRHPSAEAPAKTSFFGGRINPEPRSRLDQDYDYLTGKAPEPEPVPLAQTLPDNSLTGRLATF